jgi:predicted transcriptional regulator
VVDKVFDGTPVAMVKSLLGNSKIDETELDELKKLIRALEKKA